MGSGRGPAAGLGSGRFPGTRRGRRPHGPRASPVRPSGRPSSPSLPPPAAARAPRPGPPAFVQRPLRRGCPRGNGCASVGEGAGPCHPLVGLVWGALGGGQT